MDRGASHSMMLTGVGSLVTNRPGAPDIVGEVPDGAVAIVDGAVAWVGPEADLPEDLRSLPRRDCGGRAVIPGFVDPHTHVVFAGDRSDEFARRLRGESYEEIMAAGGGIHSTVTATRSATPDELLAQAGARVRKMLAGGTTTVEIKSGYGLDVRHEKAMLDVAGRLGDLLPVDVVRTFLGAHVVPTEFADDRAGYVRLIVEEMLPACAPAADFCDVFCDVGAFTVDEARTMLSAARKLGLGLRLHADQLARTGAARLGAELGAVAVDHLDHVTHEDMVELARHGVVGVVMPGVSLNLRLPYADGPGLWEAGVAVALATDCNPGTAYHLTMPFVYALAVLEMGLTPEQALWSATRGGALAVERSDRGWVVPGAVADLVVLDAPSYLHLAYRPDDDLVAAVIKRGELVVGALD